MFDSPHLIKSVRNILLKNDLKTDDGVVSWEVVEHMYELDRQGATRMCPKLTEDHVITIKHNTFKKMRVSYATQVLSRTVSCAIDSLLEFGSFSTDMSAKAVATSAFIIKMDRLFDVFNSQRMNFADEYKAPIHRDKDVWKSFLTTMETYLDNISVIPKHTNEKKKTVKAFDGLRQNINAVIQMTDDIFKDLTGVQYILLGRFSQDVLENTFSKLRGGGGNNCFPSIRNAMYFLRHECNAKISKLLVSKHSNSKPVEESPDNFCATAGNEKTSTSDDKNEEIESAGEDSSSEIDVDMNADHIKPTNDDLLEGTTTENAAISYFIGYIQFKMEKKTKCEDCTKSLSGSKEFCAERDAFIRNKNYRKDGVGGLQQPSPQFFEVCCFQVQYFKSHFKKAFFIKKLKQYFTKKIIAETNAKYPEWFAKEGQCYEHRVSILDFLLLVLIRKNSKWLLEEKMICKRDTKNRKKIKKNNMLV